MQQTTTNPTINHDSETVAAQLRDKAKDVKEDVGEMAHIVRDASAERVAHAKAVAQEQLATGQEKLVQSYEAGREKLAETYEAGREKVTKWENNLEKEIREHPLRSVLVAAGAGALAGLFLRR